MAFDRDQRFNRCCRRAPGGEEGEVAVGDATPDQQAACPQAVTCIVEWLALEIGQFEITPIMQPQFLGSGSCRQVLPVGRAPRRGDVSCRARGRRRRSRVSRGSWQQPTAWVGYQEGERTLMSSRGTRLVAQVLVLQTHDHLPALPRPSRTLLSRSDTSDVLGRDVALVMREDRSVSASTFRVR